MVWIYHIFVIGLSIGRHLDCVHLWAIMNNIAINMVYKIFEWMYIFSSLGCMPGSETFESHE